MRLLDKLALASGNCHDGNRGRCFGVNDALWGDSGKGAVAGRLVLEGATSSVRFSGGMNAGHTSEINDVQYITNLVPCSVLYGGVGAIGPMCAIMPFTDGKIPAGQAEPRRGFREEVEMLQAMGIEIDPSHLIVDPNAGVTCAWHLAIEANSEGNGNRIGSTGRGIAPTYEALFGKWRVTVSDCLNEHRIDRALKRVAEAIADRKSCDGIDPFDSKRSLLEWGQWLQSVASIRRVDGWMAEILNNPDNDVVLEGAQGALLDPVWSQPCSTSCPIWPPVGLGHLPNVVNIGVFKVLPSRVGEGPFPTELVNPAVVGPLRDLLHEFGATTRRPRRLGWLHFAALREGARRLGANVLIPTKLDPLVNRRLFAFDGITVDGETVPWWESEWDVWEQAAPRQCFSSVQAIRRIQLPMLTEPMYGITRADELPPPAREIVRIIAERTGLPVPAIKTGPGSEHLAF